MKVGARFWVEGGVADRRGEPDHDEEEERERREPDVQGRSEQDPLEAGGEGPPTALRVELRPPPEHAERDEGEDEDGAPAVEEEPEGDGEVPHPPDPVRDKQAHERTSNSAIRRPRRSSSTSKRPVRRALKAIRAGVPGLTRRLRS